VRVLVDGRDHLAGLRIGGQPVALADDVPLRHLVAGGVELDDGAVQVAVRARLPLRADAVLEADEDVATERGDVVRGSMLSSAEPRSAGTYAPAGGDL
jgi:hypothetical protein